MLFPFTIQGLTTKGNKTNVIIFYFFSYQLIFFRNDPFPLHLFYISYFIWRFLSKFSVLTRCVFISQTISFLQWCFHSNASSKMNVSQVFTFHQQLRRCSLFTRNMKWFIYLYIGCLSLCTNINTNIDFFLVSTPFFPHNSFSCYFCTQGIILRINVALLALKKLSQVHTSRTDQSKTALLE